MGFLALFILSILRCLVILFIVAKKTWNLNDCGAGGERSWQRYFVLASVDKDFTLLYISPSALSSSMTVSNAVKYLWI